MKTKRCHAGDEFDLSGIAIPHREELQNNISTVIKEEFQSKSVDEIKVLEIGCGTGYTTSIILDADNRTRIVAVDNDEEMLEKAKEVLENKRVELIEEDALEFLKKQSSDSFDVCASAFTLHNFTSDYREKVLQEMYRVLRPGGIFVNADKYALDDESKHKEALSWQLQQFKDKFSEINRIDLIEKWTSHYVRDDQPEIIMKESESITSMSKIGFQEIKIVFRKKMEAVVKARK